MRVFLSLGTNLGDRVGNLSSALAGLRSESEVRVVAVSEVYETDPVGGPEQGAFLNLVLQLDTELPPRSLLQLCHRLETDARRVRAERWGPRTLDVDIVWIDGVAVNDPDLEIPHPRFRYRRFVMVPLLDLAPDLAEAGWEDIAVGVVRRLGDLATL